jgi:hypothetical protein
VDSLLVILVYISALVQKRVYSSWVYFSPEWISSVENIKENKGHKEKNNLAKQENEREWRE